MPAAPDQTRPFPRTGIQLTSGPVPAARPGFWVAPQPRKTVLVGVADMAASNDPTADLVTHSLGSCVGVMIHDPVRKAGGLLHLMLPDSTGHAGDGEMRPFMFADTGLPKLFHAVYALGGDRGRLVIKLAGGAQVLDDQKLFNVGQRNVEAVLALLARNGLKPHATDLGGRSSRTVRLQLDSGRVTIRMPGCEPFLL